MSYIWIFDLISCTTQEDQGVTLKRFIFFNIYTVSYDIEKVKLNWNHEQLEFT